MAVRLDVTLQRLCANLTSSSISSNSFSVPSSDAADTSPALSVAFYTPSLSAITTTASSSGTTLSLFWRIPNFSSTRAASACAHAPLAILVAFNPTRFVLGVYFGDVALS